MNRMMLSLLVAGLVTGAGSVWAGSGCCSWTASKAREAKVEAKKEMACAKALTGIELTEDQTEKVAAITAECEAAGCSKEACDASVASIREVLTDDQKAAFDAAVEAAASEG